MPVDTLCSECGTELSSRELSRGLCPGCLLSLGLDLSVEAEIAEQPQPFPDMIGASVSRYLILEQIGAVEWAKSSWLRTLHWVEESP